MRIRFLVSIASATWSYGPGNEADFPDAEARAHIAGGNAVPVDDASADAPEAAVLPVDRAERAARPSAKKAAGR